MALDFPSNPADGEVFGSYIWSASKGVWQSREESAAPAITSPVPPANPNSGDIWFDSSDGISYVYYDDGNSGSWVEMISSGVTSLALKADITYVDQQDALKANLASPTFTGTVSAQTISASQRIIGTTPVDNGSTGGVAIKAPPSGTQTSAYLQFVNNAYTAQWGAIEATSASHMKLMATYVLTPNQPAFCARGVSTTGAGTKVYLFNQTIDFNTGSHYNSSTGRFTAPVAGVYLFEFHLFTTQGDRYLSVIRKNGNTIQEYTQEQPTGSSGQGYASLDGKIFMTLAANDYVDVQGSAPVLGTNVMYSSFSGRLMG